MQLHAQVNSSSAQVVAKAFQFLLAILFTLSLSAASAQIGFNRYTRGPVIPAANSNTSWHGFYSANPVVIEFNGTYFLYARGIATAGAPSTLGVWTSAASGFNGVTWNQNPTANPILQAGASGAFDSTGIFDPSAVVFNGKVYVYYAGYANGSNIGLATSSDGLHFTKAGQVWANGGTPFPVVDQANGQMYLFYTQATSGGGWEYWVTTSTDGVNFGAGQRVFSPSGVAGTFDQKSVITMRVWYEAPYYYMTYGGSPTCPDYPEGIGLARSTDLINWQRYPNNPILLRGPVGGWDEAAVWSGSMLKVNGTYYMWYEAAGSNAGAGSSASNSARNSCYGGYGSTSYSQVGLATAASIVNLTDWTPSSDISPTSTYTLTAQNSSQCLDVAGGSMASGTKLDQQSCTSNLNQQWTFTSENNGFYEISSVNSGRAGNEVLDVPGQSATNGTVLDQAPWTGSTSQQWLMAPTAAGTYQVINRNSSDSLDVVGNSKTAGASVDQWPWNAQANQQWALKAAGTVSQPSNYVLNPGFEASGPTQNPPDWAVWSGDGNPSASFTESGGHTGNYRLTQYSANPEQTYTYQNINVPNGTYTLTAWVVGGGAQTAAYLSAKNYGGSELTANVIPLETGWPNWKQVTISNIPVTTGAITIGAYSYSPSPTTNDYVSWDDFVLTKQ